MATRRQRALERATERAIECDCIFPHLCDTCAATLRACNFTAQELQHHARANPTSKLQQRQRPGPDSERSIWCYFSTTVLHHHHGRGGSAGRDEPEPEQHENTNP